MPRAAALCATGSGPLCPPAAKVALGNEAGLGDESVEVAVLEGQAQVECHVEQESDVDGDVEADATGDPCRIEGLAPEYVTRAYRLAMHIRAAGLERPAGVERSQAPSQNGKLERDDDDDVKHRGGDDAVPSHLQRRARHHHKGARRRECGHLVQIPG